MKRVEKWKLPQRGHRGCRQLFQPKFLEPCLRNPRSSLWPEYSNIINSHHFHPDHKCQNCHLITWWSLRRGVRSDAQLSCTDTRFQKCSQSGKNGSKHPMLSISMAYNVISCKKNRKKHSKNQIRWFYYVNLAPDLRNDQKLPNNGSLNCDLPYFRRKKGTYLQCKKMYLPESSKLSLTTQITSSHRLWEEVICANLQISSLESRPSINQISGSWPNLNFKISTKDHHLD